MGEYYGRSGPNVKLYTAFLAFTLVLTTICAGFNVSGYYLVATGLPATTKGKRDIDIYAEISNFLIFIYWTYILVFTILTLSSKQNDLWEAKVGDGIHLNSIMQVFCGISLIISIAVFVLMILAIVNTKNVSSTTSVNVGWGLWIGTTIAIGLSFIFVCGIWYTLFNGKYTLNTRSQQHIRGLNIQD